MAKSKKNAASAGPPPLWPNLAVDLRDPRLHQAGAALLALVGLILTLSTIGIVLPAAFTNAVGGAARDLLGPPGALALGLSLTGGGLWLLRALIRGQMTMPLRRVIGGEVLFFAALALLQMLFENSGGKVGWAIANVLSRNLGDLPSAGLLLLIGSVGAIWAFNLDPAQAGQWGAQMWGRWRAGPVPDWIGDGSGAGGATTAAPAPEPPAAAAEPKRERKKAAPKEKKPAAKADQPAPAPDPVGGRRLRRDKRLPVPGDLFHTRSKLDIDREEMNERARIIEQTLDSFGIPVKVIEMQQGPTVTQFGVSPGFVERRMPNGQMKQVKIKVSQIASLSNDLALALSAAPIRIEAPVPGKSIVGVEVPNVRTSMVSLMAVLDSDEYKKFDRPLKVALGQDVAGRPHFADLTAMPHLLIAGATGSGKSVCINAVIASLLCNNTPDDLRLLMIDPKMVELINYNRIPHLLHPVVTDLAKAVGALQWAMGEMDQRYQKFKDAGARNLDGYNKKMAADGEETLPYIVIIIDELADLMMTAPEEIERSICRLAQMSRATGIHLIIATQRPSVDVVTGLIKANFPARISFAVTSQTDSRVILDTGGAEKLLGRGDMLYMAPDSPKLLRLQGCHVADEELRKLVRHWKDVALDEQLAEAPIQLPAAAPAASKEKNDELLDEAIKLVQQFDRASTSFLQRRMGIGYNRAAKLIDLMEARGIIGPTKEGGLSREVLLKAEVGDDDDETE